MEHQVNVAQVNALQDEKALLQATAAEAEATARSLTARITEVCAALLTDGEQPSRSLTPSFAGGALAGGQLYARPSAPDL